MTKQPAPISAAQAMTRIMGVLSIDTLKKLVGRSDRTLYAWRDPDRSDNPTHQQSIAMDLAYAKAGGIGAPFYEHHAALLRIGMSDRRRRFEDLLAAARNIQSEAGDANSALLGTLAHDADEHDVEAARRELTQLAAAVHDALATLSAPPESPPATDTG